MFDHVLTFADEDAAKAALQSYGTEDEGQWHWDGSRVLANVKIVMQDAVWDMSDPENPVETSPEVTIPGYHIVISLPDQSSGLTSLTDNVCRVVASRALLSQGQEFTTYVAPDMDPSVLSGARVDPTFSGADYPFGG